MASGSEVHLIIEAGVKLVAEGVNLRLISFPSWELFAFQSADYQHAVLPSHVVLRLAVEAGVTMGWHRWVGDQGRVLGIDHFGASAPYQRIYQEFGLTVDRIVLVARQMLESAAANAG